MTNRIVFVGWEDRLEVLYCIAENGGSSCAEEILDEYSENLRKDEKNNGGYFSIEYEEIPIEQWNEFIGFIENQEE